MRALLDEQLSPQIGVVLRAAGYDVLAVADRQDILGCSDRIVFETASREVRALVTNNIKDFRPLAAEWLATGRIHPGLILLPSGRTRTRSAVPALAAAVEAILRANPDGIAGGERWVGPLPRDEN